MIGLFGRWEASIDAVRISRALDAMARAIPGAIFLSFDSDLTDLGDRFLRTSPQSSEEAGNVIPALDLAIHLDNSEPSTIPGLLRAGIPTIALVTDPAEALVPDVTVSDVDELCRLAVELASDPGARSARFRSAHAYCFGTADPSRASTLLLEQVERCAFELRRGSGRNPRKAEGSRALMNSPHFPRAASATGEAASRLR